MIYNDQISTMIVIGCKLVIVNFDLNSNWIFYWNIEINCVILFSHFHKVKMEHLIEPFFDSIRSPANIGIIDDGYQM